MSESEKEELLPQLQNLELDPETLALEEMLNGFSLKKAPSLVPGEIIPSREINKKILQEFFVVRPTVASHQQAALEVSKKVGVPLYKVIGILQKASAQSEAKKQREEYADLIYSQKMPLAKSIVGKSLMEVDEFLTTFKPSNVQEAKDLVKMATDMTTLLRLELGQSTERIEIIQKTHKDVTIILEELRQTDPFMDYGDTDDNS